MEPVLCKVKAASSLLHKLRLECHGTKSVDFTINIVITVHLQEIHVLTPDKPTKHPFHT